MTDKDLSEKRAKAGRKGGLRKVPKGASKMPIAEVQENGRKGAKARWKGSNE